MDRTLALYSLGTFAAYIVCFKTTEYIIAFMLDDALVRALNQNATLDSIIGLILSTIAFGVAFSLVAVGRVKGEERTIATHMIAPFVIVGFIAIGRGLGMAELVFRCLFIVIVFLSSEALLRRHAEKHPESDVLDALVTGPSKRSLF